MVVMMKARLLMQASPNKPVVVFIRDTTSGTGGQQEVTSSGDVDRRHGILRLPVSLATTRSPSDSDTNSGDSGRGPSCDEATDPTTNNNTLRVTTIVTRAADLSSPRSPASGKHDSALFFRFFSKHTVFLRYSTVQAMK